jgi:diaminohydroxyphosphoribosylaminopyrimidine deaminase/5-amino-6-(5-phosphoribosylamino)uracil reductase
VPGAAALRLKGARVEAADGSGALDLAAVLARLGQLEVNELLVEAGPTLTGALVRQRLVDELLLYIAPRLLGPQGRPLFELPQLENLQQAETFKIRETRQIGPDLRVRMRPE